MFCLLLQNVLPRASRTRPAPHVVAGHSSAPHLMTFGTNETGRKDHLNLNILNSKMRALSPLELILIQIKTASTHRSKGCNSFYFLLSSRRSFSFAILGIYFLPAARADRSSNGPSCCCCCWWWWWWRKKLRPLGNLVAQSGTSNVGRSQNSKNRDPKSFLL